MLREDKEPIEGLACGSKHKFSIFFHSRGTSAGARLFNLLLHFLENSRHAGLIAISPVLFRVS